MARQTLQPDTTRQASAQAGALPVSGQIWDNLCGLARSKTLWGVLLLAVLWGYGYAMNTPAVDMDDLAIATYQQGGELLRQGRITVWLLQALTGIMTYQRFWPELFFALSLVLAGILLAAVLYSVVFGATDALVGIFNSENSTQMAQFAHMGMRLYFVGYFFAGFNIVAAGYLSATNRPVEASVTSICRGVAAIVVCSLVMSALFGMNGVWAAFPASELLTALLTLCLLLRGRTGKNAGSD